MGLPAATAVCALVALHLSAPAYLLDQGFPLDDAWIHAVYARELSASGLLAYNPGVPATGETSPLWAVVLAIVHAATPGGAATVAWSKLAGFLLHAASATVAAVALYRASGGAAWLWPAIGGALAAAHPDLVAASVSGMEVPLANCLIALSLLAAVSDRRIAFGVLGAAAYLARPEAAIPVVALSVFWIRERRTTAFWLAASGTAGVLLAAVSLALRNLMVSGLPLPATFYAKANLSSPFHVIWQRRGFVDLMGELTLFSSPILLGIVAALSVLFLLRRAEAPANRAAAAASVAGLAFCVVSFALVPPVDANAFYHQRYVLPALLPLTVALPTLCHALVWRLRGASAPAATLLVCTAAAVLMVRDMPLRAQRLSNDARNIDDVQVRLGLALASAEPGERAWIVDAGAARFFGRAFVVDLMGLNTFELLTPGAQAYMDEHPPTYLDVFPGWSRVEAPGGEAMPATTYETTTPYTVTSTPTMRSHTLVRCQPAGRAGTMQIQRRAYPFACAGARQ